MTRFVTEVVAVLVVEVVVVVGFVGVAAACYISRRRHLNNFTYLSVSRIGTFRRLTMKSFISARKLTSDQRRDLTNHPINLNIGVGEFCV